MVRLPSPALLSRFFLLAAALVCTIVTLILLYSFLQYPYGGFGIQLRKVWESSSGNGGPYYSWETVSSFSPVRHDDAFNATIDDLCRSFPQQRIGVDVVPVLKLGQTENSARVQAQFESVSACIDDLIVVSDRDDEAYGHEIIDVLNDLPESYFEDNDQLVNYTIVRDAWNTGHAEEMELPEIRGWDLDKYKFLPMVERAWMMRPDRKWYMFYEADTYVVWDNLFRFIDNLDPDTPLYVGAPALGRGGSYLFAYGGGGFLLSRAAMQKVLKRDVGEHGELTGDSLSGTYRDDALPDCCGDGLLGWAMLQVGIVLTNFDRLFAAPRLSDLEFGGPGGSWCQPILTMHRTSPENTVKLWRWEHQMRTNREPLLYRDFFDFHHANNPATQVEDWDNCGEGYLLEVPAESAEACELACANEATCVQYRWHGRRCRLMDTARYGHPRGREAGDDVEEDAPFVSGWNAARMQELGQKECGVVQWQQPK